MRGVLGCRFRDFCVDWRFFLHGDGCTEWAADLVMNFPVCETGVTLLTDTTARVICSVWCRESFVFGGEQCCIIHKCVY